MQDSSLKSTKFGWISLLKKYPWDRILSLMKEKMKFVFNYTRLTNRVESIVVGRLIISSSFNHEFVVTYTNLAGDNQLVIYTGPRQLFEGRLALTQG